MPFFHHVRKEKRRDLKAKLTYATIPPIKIVMG
jgi:hypothetical protein